MHIMAKVVLISCSKSKLGGKAMAADMYTGALFRLSLQYAKMLKPDKLFILSAKHHLLAPNTVIEPYDLSLNSMNRDEISKWTETVIMQLHENTDIDNDTFIMLAGSRYAKPLKLHLRRWEDPLEGLSLGNRLKKLKTLISNREIHG